MGGCASKPKGVKEDIEVSPLDKPMIKENREVDVVKEEVKVVGGEEKKAEDDGEGNKRRSLSHLFEEEEKKEPSESEEAIEKDTHLPKEANEEAEQSQTVKEQELANVQTSENKVAETTKNETNLQKQPNQEAELEAVTEQQKHVQVEELKARIELSENPKKENENQAKVIEVIGTKKFGEPVESLQVSSEEKAQVVISAVNAETNDQAKGAQPPKADETKAVEILKAAEEFNKEIRLEKPQVSEQNPPKLDKSKDVESVEKTAESNNELKAKVPAKRGYSPVNIDGKLGESKARI